MVTKALPPMVAEAYQCNARMLAMHGRHNDAMRYIRAIKTATRIQARWAGEHGDAIAAGIRLCENRYEQIMEVLKRGEMASGAVAIAIGKSRPRASAALNELSRDGLITCRTVQSPTGYKRLWRLP